MAECSACHTRNNDDARFCRSCGQPLTAAKPVAAEAACAACGAPHPPGQRFCRACGHDMSAAPVTAKPVEAPRPAPAPLENDRPDGLPEPVTPVPEPVRPAPVRDVPPLDTRAKKTDGQPGPRPARPAAAGRSGRWKGWLLLGVVVAAVAAVAGAWFLSQPAPGQLPAAAAPAGEPGTVELAPDMKLTDKPATPVDAAAPAMPAVAPEPAPVAPVPQDMPPDEPVSAAPSVRVPDAPASMAAPEADIPARPKPKAEKKPEARPKASNQHDEILRQKEALKQQLGM